MQPVARWLSNRYFAKLTDEEFVEIFTERDQIELSVNKSRANRELRRRAAREGTDPLSWIQQHRR